MDWIKIEPGCDMPNDGESVAVVIRDGKNSWWQLLVHEGQGKFFDEFISYRQPTHWARVELPNN